MGVYVCLCVCVCVSIYCFDFIDDLTSDDLKVDPHGTEGEVQFDG